MIPLADVISGKVDINTHDRHKGETLTLIACLNIARQQVLLEDVFIPAINGRASSDML